MNKIINKHLKIGLIVIFSNRKFTTAFEFYMSSPINMMNHYGLKNYFQNLKKNQILVL